MFLALASAATGSSRRVAAIAAGGGGGTPAWRAGRTVNAWATLSGVNVRAAQTYTAPSGPQASSDEKPGHGIFMWSGGALVNDRIVHLGGGHTNSCDNAVFGLYLATDSPAWALLRGPTANGSITANATHYADGRPTSRHNYFESFPDNAANKLMMCGLGSGYGNNPANTWAQDAFDVTSGDYDAAGSYPTATSIGYSHQTGLSACQNPSNSDVFVIVPNNAVLRRNGSNGNWSSVGGSNFFNDSGDSGPAAWDSSRTRFLVAGSGRAKVYTWNGSSTSEASVTFTGASAGAITNNGTLIYCSDLDCYFYWSGSSGDSNLYQIDPSTWAVSVFSTTGTPPAKSSAQGLTCVYSRFLYLPQYKCIAHYGATTTDDFTFLPLVSM